MGIAKKATNRVAVRAVLTAWKNLLILKNNDTPKTDRQAQKLDAAIAVLKAEFLRLKGASQSDSYDKAAGQLGNATDALNDIVAERKKLADAFVTAQTVRKSIGKVLSLLV